MVTASSVTASSVSAASTYDPSHGDHVFHPDPVVLADSHFHSIFGSKKVNFAIFISRPEQTPLRRIVDRALQVPAFKALDVPEPLHSINFTAHAPLLRNPIAVALETKSPTGHKVMIAAFHRRLATLSVPYRPAPVRLIPTTAVILIVNHNWTLYFALHRCNRIVSLP